jgi:hypothetical protein
MSPTPVARRSQPARSRFPTANGGRASLPAIQECTQETDRRVLTNGTLSLGCDRCLQQGVFRTAQTKNNTTLSITRETQQCQHLGAGPPRENAEFHPRGGKSPRNWPKGGRRRQVAADSPAPAARKQPVGSSVSTGHKPKADRLSSWECRMRRESPLTVKN